MQTKKENDDFFQQNSVGFGFGHTPDNIVITATGNIKEEETLKLIDKYFNFSSDKKQTCFAEKFSWKNFNENAGNNKRVFIRNKKTEQAQIVIGYPSFDRADERNTATRLLSIILGGNMSSRMFSSVREEKGLCYSIGSSVDSYTDCSLFSTRAGITIERIKEAIDAIKSEYLSIASDVGKVTEKELQRAKNYLKGSLALSMEDSASVANFLGTQFVLKDDIKTIDEFFKKVDNITVEDISAVAKELFVKEKIAMALIGPFEGQEKELEEVLLA
ncbi:TPA: insulinase family protein [Candidatus Peregrinibacteria bacterium]|nr:insulinase family protein [Candidatus Peregrinibacteria bacterium]